MSSQNPPPGWYATDVPGQQRWWDGTQWTGHVSANPVSTLAASATQAAAAPARLLGKSDPRVARGLGIAFTALGGLALILVFLSRLVLSFDSILVPVLMVLFGLVFLALGALSLVDARVGFRLRNQSGHQSAQPPAPHA